MVGLGEGGEAGCSLLAFGVAFLLVCILHGYNGENIPDATIGEVIKRRKHCACLVVSSVKWHSDFKMYLTWEWRVCINTPVMRGSGD